MPNDSLPSSPKPNPRPLWRLALASGFLPLLAVAAWSLGPVSSGAATPSRQDEAPATGAAGDTLAQLLGAEGIEIDREARALSLPVEVLITRELLEYVLSNPPDRVRYTQLGPMKADFDEIMELAFDVGVLSRRVGFEEYVDDSFVRPLEDIDWNMDALPGVEDYEVAQ